MFYVTSLDGSQVEPLIGWGTDFILSQSVDGTFTVSSTVLLSEQNAGYNILDSETIITIDGCDFRVKQFTKMNNAKNIVALSIFFDHSKTHRDGIFSGSHTLTNHLNYALNGTGWTFTADSSIANKTNFINQFGDDNVISLINKICKYHQCEYVILPGKKLHFAKQIGPDADHQYRYKHNVSDVVLKKDTSNLTTFIRGFGADGLTVSYTSPNAAIPGIGIREAEPVRDDRFTDATALLNYIKTKIQDEPELAIESTIPELTSREIGERVWLFYEPLGIEMQTRILKQNKKLVRVNGELKLVTESVVFGNTLIQDSGDLLVEHQEQINDNKDYIDETNDNLTEAKKEYTSKFEQTDERITLEVDQLDKSIAAVSIKADNINLSVNNRITQEVAAIDVRANQIQLSVTNLANSTSSSINLLNNQISLKVDANGIISAINMSPEYISISADRINLNGAVMVNGSISGATNIDVNMDLYAGNSLYLRGWGDKAIRFSSSHVMETSSGELNLYGLSGISLGSFTRFYGSVDFSQAYVTGLPTSK